LNETENLIQRKSFMVFIWNQPRFRVQWNKI